jgi:hypothetical protein
MERALERVYRLRRKSAGALVFDNSVPMYGSASKLKDRQKKTPKQLT